MYDLYCIYNIICPLLIVYLDCSAVFCHYHYYLICSRFGGNVKLKSIKVIGGGEGSHPSELRMLVKLLPTAYKYPI